MGKDGVFEELQGNIGTEAADCLVDTYAGSNLYIPKGVGIRRKHKEIREEFKQGAGYKELARRYGYTEMWIRQIVHKRRPKGSQK
jgi:Mor family transcriptional regulator